MAFSQHKTEERTGQFDLTDSNDKRVILEFEKELASEESIVGVGYDCLSIHGPNGYCENCQKYEENKCCEKCKSECWRDNTAYYFPCECHKESPQAKEKESKCMKAHCKCMNIGNGCTNHHYNSPDCFGWLPKEPVSERNALIDELIEEVDRIELCRHDMVRIFVLLESKKK